MGQGKFWGKVCVVNWKCAGTKKKGVYCRWSDKSWNKPRDCAQRAGIGEDLQLFYLLSWTVQLTGFKGMPARVGSWFKVRRGVPDVCRRFMQSTEMQARRKGSWLKQVACSSAGSETGEGIGGGWFGNAQGEMKICKELLRFSWLVCLALITFVLYYVLYHELSANVG